jgi:hypothetical protein
MVVEVGAGQADAVASLFASQQPLDVTAARDLAGMSRALHIRPALGA